MTIFSSMKKVFISTFTLLLFECVAFSQSVDDSLIKILVVPLKKENITIRGEAVDMLKYNNISKDSAKRVICRIIDKTFYSVFKGYNIQRLAGNNKYGLFYDSLEYLKEFTSMQLEKMERSKGFKQTILFNLNNAESGYYGSLLDSVSYKNLSLMQQEFKFNYLVNITKFEMTGFGSYILHCEVFDKSLTRIYGGRKDLERSMSKKMFFDAAKHFTQLVAEQTFSSLIK